MLMEILKMDKNLRQLFLLLLALLAVFSTVQCSQEKTQISNKPVVLAKVGPVAITVAEFQKEYDKIKSSYDSVSLQINKNLSVLKKSLLNQMITNVILKREAHKMDIKISDEELSPYLEKLQGEFSNKELRQMILQKNINYAEWKQQQKDYLLIKKLTEKVVEGAIDIKVSDSKKYFRKNIGLFKKKQQVRIRQIVVDTDTLAGEIQRKLKKGGKFEELAATYSLSPDKKKGGDIGWFEKGRKIPAFDIAFKLNVGKVSKIIKSPYGYHIIKVIGKKPAVMQTFRSVRAKIEKKLSLNKRDKVYKTWLEKKISETNISQNNKILEMIR
jgi:parvulin-like peptidyl-prolyl isomerase